LRNTQREGMPILEWVLREQKFQYVPPGSCGDEGRLNGQLARYQLNGNLGNTKTILSRFMNSRKAVPASRGVSRGFDATQPLIHHISSDRKS
jgi:hypothetical protein